MDLENSVDRRYHHLCIFNMYAKHISMRGYHTGYTSNTSDPQRTSSTKGYGLCISISVVPAILQSPNKFLPSQWRATYDFGRVFGPFLAVFSTADLIIAAYERYHHKSEHGTAA